MVYAVRNGGLLVSFSAGLAASGCLATGKSQGLSLSRTVEKLSPNCHEIAASISRKRS